MKIKISNKSKKANTYYGVKGYEKEKDRLTIEQTHAGTFQVRLYKGDVVLVEEDGEWRKI